MRGTGLGLLMLALVAWLPGSASAGVYNPGESEETATYPDFIDSFQGRNFRDVIFTLRSIAIVHPQVDNPVRRRYVFGEELIGKSGPGPFKLQADYLQTSLLLTRGENFKEAEQLLRPIAVTLEASAVLIRRRKFKEAEGLLRPIAVKPEERDNIPIQSNFATALHMSGDLQGAYETLRPVLKDHWGDWGKLSDARRGMLEYIGWSETAYDRNRAYDTYYLKLLRLRKRERIVKAGKEFSVQLPDALFDDGKDPPTPVRFLNDDGDFEAGSIAASERAKLPRNAPDALAIVQQLLVWMPEDLRLYWLLGELYNAQKNEADKTNRAGILAARRIFIDLDAFEASDDVRRQLKKRIGVLNLAKGQFDEEDQAKLAKSLTTIEKNAPGFTVDWRTVGISFALGFVLAFFVLWQIREIQRRRQTRHNKNSAPV